MNKNRANCNIFDKIKTMEFYKKDIKYLLILFIFLVINIIIFGGHITNIYMDMGREFYFPQCILNGEVLYKDIFNIFGPFSYLFNAMLFKIFKVDFSVIYNFAIFNSFIIILLTYLISKKILSRFCSFSIAFLCIAAGCHSLGFSTYFLPYTYAMVYGMSFSLASIYLFLKFLENNQKIYLYFAMLCTGFACTNKYEFFILPVILFFMLFIYKKQSLKTYSKCVLIVLAPFVALFSVLFLQGLTISDFINYIPSLTAYAKSIPLKILYINIGVYPSIISTKECLLSFIALFFSLGVLFLCFKAENKVFRTILLIACLFLMLIVDIFFSLQRLFACIAVLNTVLALIFAKKITKSPEVMFILLATIALSLKSYWRMIAFGGYGLFIINLNLIVFLYLIGEYFFKTNINKKAFSNAFCFDLFIVTILVLIVNFNVLKTTNEKIETVYASFYTNQNLKNEILAMTNFAKKIKPEEKLIILPEGLFINFAEGIKSDNNYNIFTPDRLQSYGENKIIEYYKKTKPDYFILMDTDYLLYGTRYICKDFGQNLCRYINENYKLTNALKYDRSLLMFQKL